MLAMDLNAKTGLVYFKVIANQFLSPLFLIILW